MSVLGKILIVLNLLAAGGFTYVATDNLKKRQELTYAEFRNVVQLKGLPIAAPEKTTDVGPDHVPFVIEINPNTNMDTLAKETLNKLIPKGDQDYGGEAVADQTAEVKRVRAKVLALINAGATPLDKLRAVRQYNLNLARSGAERDGVIALFDILDQTKALYARADLPYLATSASQIAALKALVDIGGLGDPATITPAETQASRIKGARDSVARLVMGEINHASGGSQEAFVKLERAALDALKPAANDAARQNLAASASVDVELFKHLADLAVNPLATRANVEAAAASIREFVLGKTVTAQEKIALGEVLNLIAGSMNPPESVEKAAFALLEQKFEEAEAPAANAKPTNGSQVTPESEKARRIAHLLYHIDAHRAYDQNAREARSQWHTRVSMIVGLPEYVRAAEAQATEYVEANNRLMAVITEEQSSFEAEYQTRVQRAAFLNSQLASVEAQLKQQNAITQENDRLYKERVTERDNLKTELAKAIEDTKSALDKLKDSQSRLFKIQKDLRNAQEALLTLEKELRRLELGSATGL